MASDLVYAGVDARHDWYFSCIVGETMCRRCGKARKLGQLFERCDGWPNAPASDGCGTVVVCLETLTLEITTLRTALAEQSRLNAEAYRRGVEDAAKVADQFGSTPAGASDGLGTRILQDVDGMQIAAAIRSLPADKEGA